MTRTHPNRLLLVCAAAALLGALAYESPLACGTGFAALLATLRPRRVELFASMGVFIAFASLVAAKVTHFDARRLHLRGFLAGPTRCATELVVTTSPTQRRDIADPSSGVLVTKWQGRGGVLECGELRLEREFYARVSGGPSELARGDRVRVIADLGIVELFRNPALPSPLPSAARRSAELSGNAFDVEILERARGPLAWLDRTRAHVRERILATYPEVVAPLGRALVLGENDLDDEEAKAFAQSGLAHLLAVSGTHLVLFVGTMAALLRGVLVRVAPLAERLDVGRIVGLFSCGSSLFYAEFSGGSGSAYRAAFMLCLTSGARALGYRLGGFNALAGSVLVGLLVDPLYSFDLSFLLSVFATAGLIALGQPLAKALARGPFSSGPLGHLRESLAATLSATLFCAPILALLADEMTSVALLANVVAAPFGELFALPACLLHSVFGWFPAAEKGLALLGGGALWVVRKVALVSAAIEVTRFSVPWPSSFLLLRLGLVGLFVGKFGVSGTALRRVGVLAAAMGLLILSSFVPERGKDRFRIVSLDIGQGDSTALHFPNGEIALVDGGGAATGIPDTAERVLLPYLRKFGKTEVDLMILSHAHPDHYKGLLGVARRYRVREFWHPEGAIEPFGEYRELLELVKKGGGVIRGPKELCEKRDETSAFGGTRRVFGVRVEILAPCPGPEGMGLNDESLVLRFDEGGRRFLFMGDAEHEGEERLLRTARSQLGADVLKVGHHGSATSTRPEFVRAVNPAVAVISCGIRNRFGHPRAETLETLTASGVGIHRTDFEGGFEWSIVEARR